MVTTTASPTSPDVDHVGPAEPGRRSTARSVVRSAGAFIDAAVRVVLFGGDFKH